MRKTHVTTFGFEYRHPPENVDRVYDVRDLVDVPFDTDQKLEQRADDIMEELNPGDSIAIGCDYGHDRSVYIATLIARNYPGVEVDHLDYDSHSEDQEDEEDDHASTQREKPTSDW